MKEEILTRIRHLMAAATELRLPSKPSNLTEWEYMESICGLIADTLEVMAVMVESDGQPTSANTAKQQQSSMWL